MQKICKKLLHLGSKTLKESFHCKILIPGLRSWSRLPLTIITKLNKFLLDWELYNKYAWQDRNKSEETQKQYEEEKKECMEELEAMVVLSLVVESSIESSFQVRDV